MLVYLRQLTVKCLKAMFENEMKSMAPPSTVRGMKVLDRNAFKKNVKFSALKIPVQEIRACKKILHKKLPQLQTKCVVNIAENEKFYKVLLLNPGSQLDAKEKELLKELGVTHEPFDHEMEIGYEHFKPKEIFKAILPSHDENGEELVSPTSFSQIGHIIHLNLREHQLPFKYIIGQVFVDKIPTARTVVHKADIINNKFRNFEMEILAGEDNLIARMVEHHTIFEFDFSKVFWNSRLSSEHNRITNLVPKTDTVFDVFAGVGPFAIPLARKGCKVYANDLNPESYKWLKHNAKLNKVKTMECYNCDGRDFIRNNLLDYLNNCSPDDDSTVHIIMNLPAIAVEFLDSFRGLLSNNPISRKIMIHVHMFGRGENAQDELRSRIGHHLQNPLPSDHELHFVRNIAPSKDMFCASFYLPSEVLFEAEGNVDEEPQSKKLKQHS